MGDGRRRLEAMVAEALGSAVEARWLVDDVLGPSRWPAPERGLTADQEARVLALVEERRSGNPLQYVVGHWSFRRLDLLVDARVLIPRPETEQVVETALEELDRVAGRRRDPVVVDLGTGTGAMALAIALEALPAHPAVQVWATDVDPDALAVASANRERLRALEAGAAARVRLRAGSWFEALPPDLRGRVDLVVANPPYVAEAEWANLQPEVRHEPYRALVAAAGSDGTPGLAAVERVVGEAVAWLARPGAVVVELAPHQAAAALDLARGAGYAQALVRQDLAGHDRAVVCRR